MVLVTPNVALGTFVVILIISAVIAWWMGTYVNYDKGAFHTFIAILAGLGVFVTFMFYYNVVQMQNKQQELDAIQDMARINDSVLNSVLDSIKKASVVIPNFVLSIMPLNSTDCCIITCETDPVTPQTCSEKMVLSYRIFALWQDIILSSNIPNFDITPYVVNFLQRANSSQLLEQWNVMKIEFSSKTQAFGDLLFEYGLPISNQTSGSYLTAAQALMLNPKYRDIFS